MGKNFPLVYAFNFVIFLDDNFYSLPASTLMSNGKKQWMSTQAIPVSWDGPQSLRTATAAAQRTHYREQPYQRGGGPYELSPTPPKLPPRDLHNKKPPLTLPEPDYETESSFHDNRKPVQELRDDFDSESDDGGFNDDDNGEKMVKNGNNIKQGNKTNGHAAADADLEHRMMG